MSPNQREPDLPSTLGWPERLLVIALFCWIVGISVFSQAFFWAAEQLLLAGGLPWPSWAWTVIGVVQGMAMLIPTVLFALVWKRGRTRPMTLVWALGALFVVLMAPMRLVQSPSVILANLMQIGFSVVAIGLLIFFQLAQGRRFGRPRANNSIWLALLIAASAAYPWLMWGALGSALDTVLNLTASLLFGVLAALILDWFDYQSKLPAGSNAVRVIILGGFVATGLLVEMASAFGFGGLQLLLLVVVPSFGLAASSVRQFVTFDKTDGSSIPVAVLVGFVAAAPALLIDPDELTLVLSIGTRDILQWAFYAALASAVIGWLWGIILVLFWSRLKNLNRRPVFAAAGVIAIALGVVLYFAVGRPGFHGDHLFVILKDQVDLTSAGDVKDIDARRLLVYETLVSHANATQGELHRALDRFGIDFQPYYLVNGLSVDGGPLLKAWLNSRPEVDRVLHNPVLRPLRAPAPRAMGGAQPPRGPLPNLQLIGADRVWQEFGVTGEGIIVGQSDSGVDGEHLDLADQYRGRSLGDDFNWYDPWTGSKRPVDVGGHGTHTLGTVLGASTGVAPGADWIGCVNLARNLANPSLYLDCMQFMLAPFPQGGDPFTDGDPLLAADVLNNSWGCPPIEGCDPKSLVDAARALRHAGIFVVVSAGNEGPFCESVSHPPAIYDEVLSVGAVDDEGALAFFSSVGPVSVDGSQRTKPDILAPGVAVLSAFPGDSYEYLDGTSMAGPHLTGVVALMWSANPALKGDIGRTEQILQETAIGYERLPPSCGDQTQPPYNGSGYGLVNAYSAVEAALALAK